MTECAVLMHGFNEWLDTLEFNSCLGSIEAIKGDQPLKFRGLFAVFKSFHRLREAESLDVIRLVIDRAEFFTILLNLVNELAHNVNDIASLMSSLGDNGEEQRINATYFFSVHQQLRSLGFKFEHLKVAEL